MNTDIPPLVIFYHVYAVKNYRRLVCNQINALVISGLYDACHEIYVCLDQDAEFTIDLPKIRVINNPRPNNERYTLTRMHYYSTKVNTSCNLLFFHTKGVCRDENADLVMIMEQWRLYMEYFVIHRWQQCVDLLQTYDCVGTDWFNTKLIWLEYEKNIPTQYTDKDHGYYSGTFWWATAKYFSTVDIDSLWNVDRVYAEANKINPGGNLAQSQTMRMQCEYLIGSGRPKHYNFLTLIPNIYGLPNWPLNHVSIDRESCTQMNPTEAHCQDLVLFPDYNDSRHRAHEPQ